MHTMPLLTFLTLYLSLLPAMYPSVTITDCRDELRHRELLKGWIGLVLTWRIGRLEQSLPRLVIDHTQTYREGLALIDLPIRRLAFQPLISLLLEEGAEGLIISDILTILTEGIGCTIASALLTLILILDEWHQEALCGVTEVDSA